MQLSLGLLKNVADTDIHVGRLITRKLCSQEELHDALWDHWKSHEGLHTPYNNAGLMSKVAEEIPTENVFIFFGDCPCQPVTDCKMNDLESLWAAIWPWIRPRSIFSKKILMGFCSDGSYQCRLLAKFEVRSFTHSWDNSDWSFGWGLRTASLGEEEAVARGSGVVPYERALVTSYRPPTVTFRLSLRVSQILPLLCSSTPLFPNPSLVSQKFPHVPLGVGGWRLGCEERRCWANCPCN